MGKRSAKETDIGAIFKILKIVENIQDENHSATYHDLDVYLGRECIRRLGIEDIEVYEMLNGLKKLLELEGTVTHNQVRSVVFHCIGIIEKRYKNKE